MKSGLMAWTTFLVVVVVGLSGIGCSNFPLTTKRNDVMVMDGVMHPVGSDQTVYAIADAYQVSPQLVMRVNNIDDPQSLSEGKRIFIPGAKEVRPIAVEKEVRYQPTALQEESRDGLMHTIQPGETLIAIADAYGLEIKQLQRINNIEDPSLIQAGQVLWVPGAKEVQDVEVPKITIRTTEPSPTPNPDPRVEVEVVPTPTPKPEPPEEETMQEFPRQVRQYGDKRFQWPIKEQFRIVKPYNTTDDILMRNNGIDLAAPVGTEVSAVADGVVMVVGGLADDFGSEWGNYIFILHGEMDGEGIYSIYAHNSETLVEEGESVERGDAIAKVGNTGMPSQSEGGTLHFEVRRGDRAINPINVLPPLQ